MNHLILAIALLSGTLVAQSTNPSSLPPGSSPANGPSYSQQYCAGFVTHAVVPRTNYILGSKESPNENSFPGRAQLFLGGPGLIPGERYTILRQIDDPNRETSSPVQRAKLSKLGALYEDIGWVTIQSVVKGVPIASFDFACDTALRGDIVVPFKQRPTLSYHASNDPVEDFYQPSSAPKGHVLGARDFVNLLGTGLIVYTDIGTAKGARPGDFLFVLRGYAAGDLNRIDRATLTLPSGAETDAAVVKPARVKASVDSRLPQRVLGEMLVLSATPESSTAIVTRSFAEMELGDVVVREPLSQERQTDGAESAAAAENTPQPCHPASLMRRLLLLHPHACQ